jgi:hypothetical protein
MDIVPPVCLINHLLHASIVEYLLGTAIFLLLLLLAAAAAAGVGAAAAGGGGAPGMMPVLLKQRAGLMDV